MRRAILLALVMGTALLLASGLASFSGFGPNGPPAAAAQTTPPDETLSGIFSVLWGDPKPGSGLEPRVEYSLIDEQGKGTKLELDEEVTRRAGGALALNGKRVSVEGRGTPGERFKVRDIIVPERMARTAADVQRTVTGSKPTATLLCRFSDSTSVTPHEKPWFETLMGGTNPGFDHYWREISYNNINLTGSQVFGWYNLPRPMSSYQTSTGYDHSLLAQDCTQAANADVNFPSYTNVNIMLNGNPGFYALGSSAFPLTIDGQTKNYSMTWIPRFAYEPGSGPGGTGQVWVAHEMGHSFGLPHSSGPYSETYDSDWDPMSDGSVCSPSHPQYGCIGVYTTSFHMDQLLGWIPPARKYTATSGSNQNITLERLGTPNSNSAYLMAQIPIVGSTTRFYTVEVRRLTGYDGQVPGEAVVIHKVDTTLSDRNAQVVDPDNNGNTNDAGAMWLPGETFTDSANGIAVQVTGSTASGYTVRIQNGGSTTNLQTFQENDRNHTQYGNWYFWNDTSLSGGYASTANVTGAAAIFKFKGTNVTWKTAKFSNSGKTAVYLDGVKVKTFDGYSATSQSGVTGYSKSGLANNVHTLKLVVTGQKNASSTGTYADVDRFLVGSTSFQENSPRVSYDTWSGAANASASGGAYRYGPSKARPAYFFYFTGPQVDLITATGPTRGSATVKVVDADTSTVAKTVTLNLNASTVQWRAKRSITGLDPAKTYYLYVLSSDGKPVVVDAYAATLAQAARQSQPAGASRTKVNHEGARPGALRVVE
jgi:M6 family metalloprotease-like protein